MSDFDTRLMMLGRTKGGTGMTPSLILSAAKADIVRTVSNNKIKADDSIQPKRYERTAFIAAHLKDTLDPVEVLRRAVADHVDGLSSAVKAKDWSRVLIYNSRPLLEEALALAKKQAK